MHLDLAIFLAVTGHEQNMHLEMAIYSYPLILCASKMETKHAHGNVTPRAETVNEPISPSKLSHRAESGGDGRMGGWGDGGMGGRGGSSSCKGEAADVIVY